MTPARGSGIWWQRCTRCTGKFRTFRRLCSEAAQATIVFHFLFVIWVKLPINGFCALFIRPQMYSRFRRGRTIYQIRVLRQWHAVFRSQGLISAVYLIWCPTIPWAIWRAHSMKEIWRKESLEFCETAIRTRRWTGHWRCAGTFRKPMIQRSWPTSIEQFIIGSGRADPYQLQSALLGDRGRHEMRLKHFCCRNNSAECQRKVAIEVRLLLQASTMKLE